MDVEKLSSVKAIGGVALPAIVLNGELTIIGGRSHESQKLPSGAPEFSSPDHCLQLPSPLQAPCGAIAA